CYRVLGEVDVAEDADQRGGAAAGLTMKDVGEVRHQFVGRTSMGRSQAVAALAAQSRAASRSAASITQKPPICSLVSAKGPSVIETSPPAVRTTVADDAGRRPAWNTQAPARSISAVSSAVRAI